MNPYRGEGGVPRGEGGSYLPPGGGDLIRGVVAPQGDLIGGGGLWCAPFELSVGLGMEIYT